MGKDKYIRKEEIKETKEDTTFCKQKLVLLIVLWIIIIMVNVVYTMYAFNTEINELKQMLILNKQVDEIQQVNETHELFGEYAARVTLESREKIRQEYIDSCFKPAVLDATKKGWNGMIIYHDKNHTQSYLLNDSSMRNNLVIKIQRMGFGYVSFKYISDEDVYHLHCCFSP